MTRLFSHKLIRNLSTVILVGLVSATTAKASVVLSVDFGLTGSPVQSGFSEMSFGSTPASAPPQTIGDFTVSIFGSFTSGRDRNNPTQSSGDFTYPDLYRSLVTNFQRGTTFENRSLSVAGLAANTAYEVRLWSYDFGFNSGDVASIYDVTGLNNTPDVTGTLLGAITNQTGTGGLVNNESFSILATVTTDADGTFSLAYSNVSGTGQINALQVIPEPSTYAWILGATIGLAVFLRRRRLS